MNNDNKCISNEAAKPIPKYSVTFSQVKDCLKKLFEQTMLKDLKSNITAHFDPINYVLYVEFLGYAGTNFENGQYFISFSLPYDYPHSPPGIQILTESGRFHVNTFLSMSISHFHSESWYVMSLEFLVIALTSSFTDFDMCGIGHANTSPEIQKNCAKESRSYNLEMNSDLANIFDSINKIKLSNNVDTINAYIKTRLSEITNSIESCYVYDEQGQINKFISEQKDQKKDTKTLSLYSYELPKILWNSDTDDSTNESHVEFFDCNENELDRNLDYFYDNFYDSDYDADHDADHAMDHSHKYFDVFDYEESNQLNLNQINLNQLNLNQLNLNQKFNKDSENSDHT